MVFARVFSVVLRVYFAFQGFLQGFKPFLLVNGFTKISTQKGPHFLWNILLHSPNLGNFGVFFLV